MAQRPETGTIGSMTSGLARAARRFGWGVGDQALSSLTNVALGILVARSLTVGDFGAFNLAFSTYLIGMSVARSIATQPLVIRYSACSNEEWRFGTASATGAGIAVGAVMGTGCILFGVVSGGPMGAAFVSLGWLMPGLLLQDCWRFAFFARGRGLAAFINDLLWAVVLFLVYGVLIVTNRSSIGWLVLGWGGAAVIAGLVGIWQARVIPSLRLSTAWLRDHRDLSTRFIGESIASSGATQFAFYGVGAVAGLTAVGAIRAAMIVLGPLHILFIGLGMVAVPEGARLLARSPEKLRRISILLAGFLGLAAVVWGILAYYLPASIGTELLGDSWQPARRVLIPLTIMMAGGGVTAGASSGLRALGAARRILRAGVTAAALVVGCAVTGAALGGAAGAAWGYAIAITAASAVWWRQFTKGLGDHVGGQTASESERAPSMPGTAGAV